jgi:trimethylamine---corrinoid protein Co-methyltransferase
MELSGLRVLSDGDMEAIHRHSLDVLERTGLKVEDAACRALLVKAGAKSDGTDRVRLPRELVEEVRTRAPAAFDLYRADGTAVHIGIETRVFGSLVIDPWIIDYRTQTPRRPRLEDVVRHTRLGEALPAVSFLHRMDMPPEDVAGDAAYVLTLEAFALNTTKPVLAAPASLDTLRNWLDVGEILSDAVPGGRKPRLIMGAPVTTPLTFDPLNATIMREGIAAGYPFCAQTEPIAGSTAPLSFAGGLLAGNCENLFLLVLSQLLRPGIGFTYSAGNALTDMSTGRVIFYNADKVLWKTAITQMARFYRVPVEGEVTGSLVGRHDTQNGIESALLMLPTILNGGGMFNGLGSCYNACGFSAEMVVMQADTIALLTRIARGIEVGEHTLAADSIMDIGPGGTFLMEPLTLEMLRSAEFYTGGCFDRLGEQSPNRPEDSMLAHAHERVEALAARPAAVPARLAAEVQRWARRAGAA